MLLTDWTFSEGGRKVVGSEQVYGVVGNIVNRDLGSCVQIMRTRSVIGRRVVDTGLEWTIDAGRQTTV